jgi:hypothetical protein
MHVATIKMVWIIFNHAFICLTENTLFVHYKKQNKTKTKPRYCWIRKLLLFVLRNTLKENAEFFWNAEADSKHCNDSTQRAKQFISSSSVYHKQNTAD